MGVHCADVTPCNASPFVLLIFRTAAKPANTAQFSHLYAGDFIHVAGNGKSPSELYVMYSYRW